MTASAFPLAAPTVRVRDGFELESHPLRPDSMESRFLPPLQHENPVTVGITVEHEAHLQPRSELRPFRSLPTDHAHKPGVLALERDFVGGPLAAIGGDALYPSLPFVAVNSDHDAHGPAGTRSTPSPERRPADRQAANRDQKSPPPHIRHAADVTGEVQA